MACHIFVSQLVHLMGHDEKKVIQKIYKEEEEGGIII